VTAQHYSLGSISQTSLDKNITRFKEEVNAFKRKNKIRYSLEDDVTEQRSVKVPEKDLPEVTITANYSGGGTASFTYGRGRPFYSRKTTLQPKEAVAFLQHATGMIWRVEPMRKNLWKAVMTDERMEKVVLPLENPGEGGFC
jgi:hypothetical protein